MTCPACGRGDELRVTKVDRARGMITVSTISDAEKFHAGPVLTFAARRGWWSRLADGVRAFRMAVRR